uniref:START domain-containing protein n=1 Tax=Aplanochytrium stocchinoi TaxID=215587 RepID=A0A7S3LHA1_9STRA|mmetsp:Transcript_3773/g.4430  ORF Transcript_3773/g.4430 Transcript_3773/m.4430 type:complete len:317 (-) Transcript_3773:87-1037(-)
MGLVFQLVFLVACLDFYINGPIKGTPRHATLALTLTALVANVDLYYIAISTVWVGLFVFAVDHEVTTAVEEEPLPDGKADESGLKKVPGPVKDLLVKSIEDFEKNVAGEKTCDGTTWKLLEDSPDLKIYRADFPGESIKRWKVECEVEGKQDKIFDQLFDWNIRLKWDTALSHGEILTELHPDGAGDRVVVNKIHTAPAGGGAVSSREMVDAGLLRYRDDGGLLFSAISVGPEFNKHLPCLPKPKSNPIRAFTFSGGGAALIPLEQSENPTKFKYILVSNVDLKGWLMTSVINSATSGALKDSTRAMLKQLQTALG